LGIITKTNAMRKLFLLNLLLFSLISQGQVSPYNRFIVDTLTSAAFWGRGYTNDGMKNASVFLANEFKNMKLQPLNGRSYFQEFTYSVNTFPGKMEVEINGVTIQPGVDFIVGPESKGLKAKGTLEKKDSTHFIDVEHRLIVSLETKLTWSAEQQVADYTLIQVDKARFKGEPSTIKVNIENKFISSFKASNICAFSKGTSKPDSFIFITAHYDHLGGMGKDTYFPGANDNASGVALLLCLARYYAEHPAKYSIGFILFAGEEPGLLGSKYYTENPIVPLKSIRFLINTDLAGTGEEGITVVNATEYKSEFQLMKKINAQYKYLAAVNERGKAANSDHYFFSEKGVRAFFFYTLGGIKAYHDVFDKSITLPLNEQEHLYNLLIKFDEALMN
jgi:aminopeptidase YwaD